MNNNIPVSDKVIEKESLQHNTIVSRPTDKEIMEQLIRQAKFAEDYYSKLVAEFQENLKKVLPKVF